ncbi:MAG: S1C family serine protease [Gemmiger sp.]
MSEYDYSGLYDSPQKPESNQTGSADRSQAQTSAGGYPNVGSSGMNTANTARTDYSGSETAGSTADSAGSQQPGGSSFHSYSSPNPGGPGAGGPTGPAHPGAGSQPPRPPKKKGGRKVGLRVLAGLGVVVLGFGGGVAGTAAANLLGLGHDQVVVQQVQRDATAQGSADGSALSMVDLSAKVKPSVVAITTEQMVSTNTWFGSYVQSGAGSGVIISEDGYILTCAHVVSGANTITVQLADNTEYSATLVGADSTSDVAVLKIEATGLTPATIGDSSALAVGETVVAVGNPMGTLSGTVTDGIVSAVNRSVQVEGNDMSLIQTNAAISPGNSGGGLFNAAGELIGIVNASGSTTTSSGAVSQNLGFAIPINEGMEVATQLIETGHVARPALGIQVINILDSQTAMQYGVSTYGVYVVRINPGSGAEAAGLQLGDRIVAVDNNSVNENNDLTSYLATKNVGDTVTLQVERDGRMSTLEVVLGESDGTTTAATQEDAQN